MRLEPLVVGFKPVTGGCLYGYDPHSRTPVTCCSFQRYYGFHRTRWSLRNFAETLIESNDPTLKMNASRWLRTAGGAKFIDGVEVKA